MLKVLADAAVIRAAPMHAACATPSYCSVPCCGCPAAAHTCCFQVVSHFLMLEELLDAAVGQTIELQLERGGKPLIVQLPVTDLHSVTPNAMLELAGGSVHALSYQQARNNRAVVGQVYVAEVRLCWRCVDHVCYYSVAGSVHAPSSQQRASVGQDLGGCKEVQLRHEAGT
jgi:hypothetical protein